MEKRFGVVLVAAGEGRRFGGPKAFVELAGRTLIERAALAFDALDVFWRKVVVLRPGDSCDLAGWTCVGGGARRRDSVAAGVAALGPQADAVLVHDAARPLVSAELVARLVEAARAAPAVIPVVAVPDTIKQVSGGWVMATPDRSTLASAQTPQAFDVGLLRRALAASEADATDEAALVEALGEPVRTVAGDPANLKVTTLLDLRLAAAVLADRDSG